MAALILLALFVRLYRVGPLLGFYFDQGRDAMVIWNLWHEGKFFLIGPVTGLAGIFLGPLYYYLIAPFYLVGGGNPVYPAAFVSFLTVIALFLLFKLGSSMHSKEAGIFALAIGSISRSLVLDSRWFSNPTPIFLTSVILLWSLWKILNKGKGYWWILAALMIGLSLQFESASAIFYLPMILAFAVWQRKILPGIKTSALALGAFFTTLLPQLIFNFRHDNILLDNLIDTFFKQKSFSGNIGSALVQRLDFFWGAFSSKIFSEPQAIIGAFFILVFLFLLKAKKLKKILVLFSLFLGAPIIGITLFQGNFGNIYDYYLFGYFLPFVLLFSIGLAEIWKARIGKLIVIIFFTLFVYKNVPPVKNYIIAGFDGPTHITLGNELQAVDWILEDARKEGKLFNVDVYVPPVIPHAYDYLFLWRATQKCGDNLCLMERNSQVPLLFTLYEVDPPHPERLEAWLLRQKGIGKVIFGEKFGGITVQRRQRL